MLVNGDQIQTETLPIRRLALPQETSASQWRVMQETESGALWPSQLSSDELGTKGEAKFKDLCSDLPGLVVNPAAQDRAGWDFVVQFAAPLEPHKTADNREGLRTCYVQVKSTWRDTRSGKVRLRLSAAEKLAKQTDPSFIVAFSFDRNDLREFDIHVIELRGPNLASVLKSLRVNDKRRRRAANHVEVAFPLKSIERLRQSTGEAIKERLAGSIGTSASAYASAKARELRVLGYDSKPLRGEITFQNIAPLELLDVFLGHRACSAKISNVTETRFGVSIPRRELETNSAEITLKPREVLACSIVVKSESFNKPLRFTGEYFYASIPGARGIIWKAKVEAKFFRLTFDAGGARVDVGHKHIKGQRYTVQEWRDFYRLALAMTKNAFEVRIRGQGVPSLPVWDFPPDESDDMPDDTAARNWLFEALSDIADVAGCDFGLVSDSEVFEKQREIMATWGFGTTRKSNVIIALPSSKEGHEDYDRTPRRSLYVGILDLAGQRIAFGSDILLSPIVREESDRWESSATTPLALEWLTGAAEDLAAFVERLKAESGLDDVLLSEGNDDAFAAALGELTAF